MTLDLGKWREKGEAYTYLTVSTLGLIMIYDTLRLRNCIFYYLYHVIYLITFIIFIKILFYVKSTARVPFIRTVESLDTKPNGLRAASPSANGLVSKVKPTDFHAGGIFIYISISYD